MKVSIFNGTTKLKFNRIIKGRSPRVFLTILCVVEEPGHNIQGEAHKVLQSDSTRTIDDIQKCFIQKFQCSRRLS